MDVRCTTWLCRGKRAGATPRTFWAAESRKSGVAPARFGSFPAAAFEIPVWDAPYSQGVGGERVKTLVQTKLKREFLTFFTGTAQLIRVHACAGVLAAESAHCYR